MTKSQSSSLLTSTVLLFIMLGFQNCGKIEQLQEPEGEYHKIDDETSSPPQEDAEFKIEKSLFDFEADEVQYKISHQDYESISAESNLCYENQMSCHELEGASKKICLKEKTRQFLKCHGYRIKENDACVLASKSFNLKFTSSARVVSVCFDHPFFQENEKTPPPRRALHIGECQQNSNTSWGQAWQASSNFLNIYHIHFATLGPKILDLAQETESKLVLTDACGEVQQANFLKLNLELNIE